MCRLLLLALTLMTPRAAAQESSYVQRFENALAAFDEGHFQSAAERFAAAGELAPGAPVWRVHAGIALARSGDEGAALRELVAALVAGYPPSDLRAIDGRLGELALSRFGELDEDSAHAKDSNTGESARWHQVSGRGRDEIPWSAAAWDHGELLELRRWDPAKPETLRPHEFLNAETLEVVVALAPIRPAGLGWRIFADGRREPLPDPRPRWMDGSGKPANQHYYRELSTTGKPLPILTRGLRSGFWLPSERSVQRATFDTDGRAIRLSLKGRDGAYTETRLDLDYTRQRATPPQLQWTEGVSGNGITRQVTYSLADGHTELVFETFYLAEDFGWLDMWRDGEKILHLKMPIAKAPARTVYEEQPVVDPSGRWLALTCVSSPSVVLGFDLQSGTLAWTFEGESQSDFYTEVSIHGTRQLVIHGGPRGAQVLDITNGSVLFDGSAQGLMRLGGSPEGGLLIGVGQDGLQVLDGITFQPLLSVWPHGSDLALVASDTTFVMDAAAVEATLVQVGSALVPARLVAPWLLDPLHLRTLRADKDRVSRQFPVR